jgi:predicted aldo/keto reductase-like oxidoreductase
MDPAIMDQIRFCAFCPNVCRFYYPAQGIPQKESMAPSALSYLALAASKGFIEFTGDVAAALSRLEAAAACKDACPYHYDIPSGLRHLTEGLKAKAAR